MNHRFEKQGDFGVQWVEPGVHDLTNYEYHSSIGISRSGIMEFLKTPAHFYDKYSNELYRSENLAESESRALIVGDAVHTLILEPHLFYKKFCVGTKINRTTKDGKELATLMEMSHIGKVALSQAEFDLIKNIEKSIGKHEHAPKLIANSVYEKSIYWTDKESGLLCKARPDIWNDNYIADLKTTACAAERSFKQSIPAFGYHIQAAMLLDAVEAVKGNRLDKFIFIAVEKTRPFAIAIYQLSEEAIEAGRCIYKNALIAIADLIEKNIWPSYEYQIVGLPKWAYHT